MAALWGENHERNIRDAMSQNFWHGVMTFLLWFVIIVGFSSPAWLWVFFT